ncbi:hypothetical protein ABZT17_26945 [Streptomyces sp. NPDC005648]|uniref:hypothetical protein n=1 Tax=Streptomyces sp. NPDC005648 TaxID=3157044 RepID=UPI0033BD88F0
MNSTAMNLIEHALLTYTEGTAMQAEEDGGRFQQQQDEFVESARSCAVRTLCEDAGNLDWQYTVVGLPEHIEEARALLAPGRLEYLRYRVDCTDEDRTSVGFELVRPCLACGHDQVTQVSSLFHLGRLLAESAAEHTDAGEDDPQDSASPLAGIHGLQARASRVTGLARHLAAQHPDAALVVQFAHVTGHQDGEGRAELRLRAASVDAAADVARTLGAHLVTDIYSTIGTYVFQRGDTTTVVDGIEVQLSAHTQLSEEEADAWRAEQLPTTDAEGGENK